MTIKRRSDIPDLQTQLESLLDQAEGFGGLTLTFKNLGVGALSAIVLYQLLRLDVRDPESGPAEVVVRK